MTNLERKRTRDDKLYLSDLCEELLKLQYQSLARLAVLKSQSKKLNQRIPLLLTPVEGVYLVIRHKQ